MNIVRDPSSFSGSVAYTAPTGYSQRPINFALQERPGAQAGIVIAPSPPRPLKDVLFTTGYAKGRMSNMGGFWDRGANVKYALYDPVSDTEVFQWHSARGAQGEGF